MTRRSLAVVVLVACVAAFGGAPACRSRDARPAPSVPASATSGPERDTVPLTVYFPNRRYVESGDESLPHVVGEQLALEVADAGDRVDALARALLAALEAGPNSAAAAPAIPERLAIRQVHVRDGVAYVDFSRVGLAGGSLVETLLVTSIVRTLTGLPEVRAVQFLVEGNVPETLMGHVTTSKPISAAD